MIFLSFIACKSSDSSFSHFEPNSTIQSVKGELYQREGISVVQQRILFHDQALNDYHRSG
jgi:hypothetical protein